MRRRADEVLSAGGVVAFPTETVYGLAARADRPEALDALRALKQSPAGRALTWHVASRAAVDAFEPLAKLARRLAQRYWPGPLTLVLQGVPPGLEHASEDGWTGVRLPAQLGTVGVLERLAYPVAMTSANRAGLAPCTSADQVVATFGAELPLVLDGGTARLAEASTVLALGPGRFEVLREGLLGRDDLRSTAGLTIGFACTGNTCRSPMAEALARHLIGQRLGAIDGGPWRVERRTQRRIADFGFSVRSMGVATSPGYPASEQAVLVMGERDIDLSKHASRLASLAEVKDCDVVYGMTHAHLDALKHILPPGQHKKLALLDPNGEDVPDPVGSPPSVYRDCAASLERMLAVRVKEWI